MPGSEASGANGLEMSEDGKTLYVAAWGSQSFFRLSRGGAKPERQEVPLGFRVDNIRWARDGSILAAGQGGTAPNFTTQIVKIDPKTLKVQEVLNRPGGRSVQRRNGRGGNRESSTGWDRSAAIVSRFSRRSNVDGQEHDPCTTLPLTFPLTSSPSGTGTLWLMCRSYAPEESRAAVFTRAVGS